MTITLDIAATLGAIIWPLIVTTVLLLYRRSIGEFVGAVGKRVHKVSFGGASLELAELPEVKTHAVDTEIRELDASLYPQSGASGIADLLTQIQHGGRRDYIVIDLGDESAPRWLTSRLYLIAFLMTLVNRSPMFVFVETAGNVRKRFIGTATPNEVRWALARTYAWLETASANTYGQLDLQFDPASGNIADYQIGQISHQFLAKIRQPLPPISPDDVVEWVPLSGGTFEHAKWIDGARLERVLGGDLSLAYVVLAPDKNVNDLAGAVLGQKGRFVATVEPDKRFRGLVDRTALLEKLGSAYSNQQS